MKKSKEVSLQTRSRRPSGGEKSRKLAACHKAIKVDGLRKLNESVTTVQSFCLQSSDTNVCFNQEKLQTLEKMFEKAADHTGALDLEGFQKVMKAMFSSMTNETLESIFWKVDADCNGLVTWHKYLEYLTRELQVNEEMKNGQYRLHLQTPMRIVPLNHAHEIIKLQFLAKQFQGSSGLFLSVTKDGILQFWDESFKLLRTIYLDQTHRRNTQQMWVNDMVCLENINLMAIASTDQDLEFFDISGNKCQRTFIFIDLDSCALVMDYWTDQHRAVFCVGDIKGNILIFISDDIVESGLFHPHLFQTKTKADFKKPESDSSYRKISMQKLLTKKSRIHRSYRLKAIHTNWCQQIKFIPELNLVASCSAFDSTAMVLTIVPTIKDSLRTSIMTHRKGILCFDYCPDKNFIVTGGYDPIILLWNPFFINKPLWQMKGHQASVTHVLVIGKSSCIISVSRDKNIRLWDIDSFLCFQSFSGRYFALGNHPITSTYFHNANDTFICGSYSIGILRGYVETQEGTWKINEESTTHHTKVCGVLYSKTFRQVVSGGLDGMVSVWELATGKKVIQFSTSESKNVELTAMILDELERSLITGMRNGTVKMWNYNIGVCLLHFPNPDQMEVSGITHVNGVFYVAGWSKKISWYLYQNKEAVPLFDHWPYFHTDDILCLAKYRSQILGSASYNGDIFIWNVSWGKPLVHFNASRSPFALKPKKVFMEENHLTLADLVNKNDKARHWAKKSQWRPLSGHSGKTHIRRNLTSAPPAMSHTGRESPMQLKLQEDPFSLQKPCITVKSKAVNLVRPQGKIWTWRRNMEKENEEYTRQKEKDSDTSVEKIIFLSTRLRTPHTATLLSSAGNGYIYAWSIHDKGGLLGKFQPGGNQYPDSVVGAMISDEKDWILITGDSKGQLKIWNIMNYCRRVSEQMTYPAWKERHTEENIYPNLIPRDSRMDLQQGPLETEEVISGQVITLIPPELLISWQAHNEGVTDVTFAERFYMIISAGADFNVKVWKISGEAIGTFGLNLWRKFVLTTDDFQSSSIPESTEVPEIKEILDWDQEDDFTKILIQQRKDQSELMSLLHSKSPKVMSRLRQLAEQSILGSVKAGKGVEDTWQKWKTSTPLKSDIVGKAYKPKERRCVSETPILPLKFMMNKEIFPRVYRCLPYKEMEDLTRPNMAILKTQTRKKKHVWLATQHIIHSISEAKQMPVETSSQSQILSFSSPVSSKNSSITSLTSLKLSSFSSFSSLKQPSSSTMPSPKKPFPSSSTTFRRKGLSNSSSSTATKTSTVTITSSVPSVKSLTPALKPLKSILKV